MTIMFQNLKALRPANRKASIRSTLMVLILVCVLPASLAAFAIAYRSYTIEEKQLLASSLAMARTLTDKLNRQMTKAEAALEALATSPSLTNADLRTFYDQAKEVQLQQDADNVVLVDLAGKQIVNTMVAYGSALPTGNSPQFSRIFESNQPVVTDVFIGAISGRPTFSIQVPVRRNNEVLYALSTSIFPERLGEILGEQALSEHQVSGILDTRAAIVARSPADADLIGRRIEVDDFDRMSREEEGIIYSTALSGTPIVAAFSKSEISGWIVYIAMPQSYFTGKLAGTLAWVVLVPLALTISSLIYAVWVGTHIAKSVTALTKPAVALGHGQAVDTPSLYLAEADEVARALAKASSMLKATQYQAQHDPLTKLANRALFNEMVQQNLMLCQREKSNMSVLYIDLDGFKAVNDTHGHGFGDELLCTVAARLVGAVRASDVAARLGGDEFAVMLAHTDLDAAAIVAQKLIDVISAPYQFNEISIAISASVGVSNFPDSALSFTGLMQAADAAMYRAKRAGKRQYTIAGAQKAHLPATAPL